LHLPDRIKNLPDRTESGSLCASSASKPWPELSASRFVRSGRRSRDLFQLALFEDRPLTACGLGRVSNHPNRCPSCPKMSQRLGKDNNREWCLGDMTCPRVTGTPLLHRSSSLLAVILGYLIDRSEQVGSGRTLPPHSEADQNQPPFRFIDSATALWRTWKSRPDAACWCVEQNRSGFPQVVSLVVTPAFRASNSSRHFLNIALAF
jgi:hypothetical protein